MPFGLFRRAPAPSSDLRVTLTDLARRVEALESQVQAARLREVATLADLSGLADRMANQLRRLTARDNARRKQGEQEEEAEEELDMVQRTLSVMRANGR